MTAIRDDFASGDVEATHDCTLVWIDTREAVVAHWHAGEVRLERLQSDVSAHHKATGHVHYDPAVRHGGVAPRDAGEAQRLEHLGRFVEQVATRIPPGDDLVILGPGTVRDRLRHRIDESDLHASMTRIVTCHAAPRLTDRQLIARLRHVAGADQRRRTTGAYRWTETTARHASGSPIRTPQRSGPKPRIEPAIDDLIEEDLA
jgi:hypothetical protein